ncbi:hypothetical protein [Desulfobacula sp.]|uniref:hypothetical protein n=1 Tax=Desulfobacula sp. TaxID=2593537 RepID=UPI0026280E7F|nr:hypothetical protein [Desulfobacula sp.]
MKNQTLSAIAILLLMTSICGAELNEPDNSFGTKGIAEAIWTPTKSLNNGKIVLQNDGKIVQVGSNRSGSTTYGSDIIIARYTSSGVLDTSFDGDGKVTTDFFSSEPQYSDETAGAIAIQTDGKIIVGGTTRTDPNVRDNSGFDWTWWNCALVRYNKDGSLDTSFSTDGKVEINANIGSADGIFDIVLQPDGKIIAAGYYMVGYNNRFLIMRFNVDGRLDTTFGNSGYVREHFTENTLETASAVAIQDDGNIVVAGYGQGADGRHKISILRLTSSGALDTTFSNDGKLVMLSGHHSRGSDVVIDANGKIIVGGWTSGVSTSPNDREFLLIRFNSNGSLDTTFDIDGCVSTVFAGLTSSVSGIALQIDGKIIAYGSGRSSDYNYDLEIARYNTDGSLDTTFDSGDGKITANLSQYDYSANVVLQRDNKILVSAGRQSDDNSYAMLAVLRYGSMDISDAIYALKVVVGITPEKLGTATDINNDRKIGLIEGIYLLQTIEEQLE